MFAIFIALIFVGLLLALLWWARKSIFGWMEKTDDIVGSGFTLSDLRQLHRAGKMTTEEFEKAKAQIVQGYTAAAQKSAKAEKTADPNVPRRSPPA